MGCIEYKAFGSKVLCVIHGEPPQQEFVTVCKVGKKYIYLSNGRRVDRETDRLIGTPSGKCYVCREDYARDVLNNTLYLKLMQASDKKEVKGIYTHIYVWELRALGVPLSQELVDQLKTLEGIAWQGPVESEPEERIG